MRDPLPESDEQGVQRPGESASSPVLTLDKDVLANLRGLPGDGDEDLLSELIDLFLKDAPSRMEQIQRALLEGNATAASQLAHSLKGSSANLGARAMAHLCNQIEQRCLSGDLELARDFHTALKEEFQRVVGALEAERLSARAA